MVSVSPEKLKIAGSEDMVLQGVIDLLSIDGDRAEIIDYKYSSLKGEALKREYAMQLDLYSYAVEKVLKKKVVKKKVSKVMNQVHT